MKSLVAALFVGISLFLGAAAAQQSEPEAVWVQIEAHPDLETARQRAAVYAARLADVNGFALGGSWYGILLGPYARPDAERVLQVYRAEGQIPRDSFIARSADLGAQFWPGADGAGTAGAAITAPDAGAAAAPQPAPQPVDETPAEARRSERLLSAEQRRDLQVALKAAGFYTAAIDGAFGAGTRRSMAEWQAAQGYEPTGVLTTRQRQELMDQYNAPLISVGMRRITDEKAGIALKIPAGEVRFARYEAPFAHYESIGALGARVLLISQRGDRATLYGLYDIMQTLEIVPLDGPRQRDGNSFTLEGRGGGIVSHTEARLEDGVIKGFTLVWPEGDEARRQRVLAEMRASFTRLDAVLDPAEGAEARQSVDLVSGLAVRKPRLTRSGFFVDGTGRVLTSADVTEGCTRITLENGHPAETALRDDGLGVALLKPAQALAPMAVAELAETAPPLQAGVIVAGFPYGGLLGAPTLTHGTLADLTGLRGETELNRLQLDALPGDIGGPVLNPAGQVVGMLLGAPKTGQQLPRGVAFAASAGALRNVLDLAGIAPQTPGAGTDLPPDDLNRRAAAITVLVSCWD